MPKCTYCDQIAVSGGYIQPPMCKKHLDIALLISLLKNQGQIPSLQNIRELVDLYRPRIDIDLDEIAELLKPMHEDGEHAES
jgi:hypothetical protein